MESTSITRYTEWFADWKKRIQSAQIKAALQVNREILLLYWELGRDIAAKQKTASWGEGLIPRFAKDLKAAFPQLTGFSPRNLFYIRKWYLFYQEDFTSIVQQLVGQLESEFVQLPVAQLESAIVPQVAAQLQSPENEQFALFMNVPWGHHRHILDKCKTTTEAFFYLQKTVENNWSRDAMREQIRQNLYERQGKAITNFARTLPKPQSDLAIETLKNPYNFDFLNMGDEALERDVEQAMMLHVEKVLLELGQGFALVGRQFKLNVEGEDYFIDLLFYHTRLHCYVVVDLKGGKFKPEYAGKMNFYCSATDDLLRTAPDQPTIGLILCRGVGKRMTVEYALRDIQKPLGVAEYVLTQTLPDNLKNMLPTIEQLERELDENFDTNP
jgi:predicted nuclease of restriction endonuclease-like (RecB) superfamily